MSNSAASATSAAKNIAAAKETIEDLTNQCRSPDLAAWRPGSGVSTET